MSQAAQVRPFYVGAMLNPVMGAMGKRDGPAKSRIFAKKASILGQKRGTRLPFRLFCRAVKRTRLPVLSCF
jgi:hypothetical protein